ncbi:MAG TPA: SsgA family sporulation/cell division regulator [Acidothermaceae bacterium]
MSAHRNIKNGVNVHETGTAKRIRVVDVRTDNVVLDLEFSVVLAENDPVKVDAHLRYDARDPFAVSVSFDAGVNQIEWTFARDLLDKGLWEAVGDGDVKVWPRAGAVFLALCSPSGKAVLETRRPAIADFMARIERIVPVGRESEFVDVDRELESLFS